MSYHLVSPGLFVPVSLILSLLLKVAHSACQLRQSDHSLHQAINVAWLKFSVLLLISKVMRQWCVVIENLTRCPPIPHSGRLSRHLTRQLNVPRKRDKTVINAKSLCLLSCSENGHCHRLLACSQRVQKGKNETGIEWKSWDRPSASVSMFFGCVCVWKQVVYSYCKPSPLSVFCVLFPCCECFYFGPQGDAKEEIQGENNQPIWVTWVPQKGIVMSRSHLHTLFVCLLCCLVVVVVLLKF